MALDTRDKRASALLGRVFPDPDGALSAADRIMLLMYSGIAAGVPVIALIRKTWTIGRRPSAVLEDRPGFITEAKPAFAVPGRPL